MTMLIWDVVVVGGGISGLSAAHALQTQSSLQWVLLEASPKLGGVIDTIDESGYRIETGPHTFQGRARHIRQLCQVLKLIPEKTNPSAHYRYVYHHHRLLPVPMSLGSFFTTPLLSLWGKLRILTEPIQPARRTTEDETVAEFVQRRLGQEALERLVEPFLTGVYAGNPYDMSAQAVMSQLVEWEQSTGSLMAGALASRRKQPKAVQFATPVANPTGIKPNDLLSFAGGMCDLIDALQRALPADRIQCNVAVEWVQSCEEGYRIHLVDGSVVLARQVIMTSPAAPTAAMLDEAPPAVLLTLESIPYVPMAVVHLAFDKALFPHGLDGFGFLTARHLPPISLLGSIWTSSLFPNRAPDNQVLLTSFMGGARTPDVSTWSEEQVIQQAVADLKTVFQHTDLKPLWSHVVRWEKAIPQYTLGHANRIQAIEHALADTMPGVWLAGNYMRGVSVDACVALGQQVVQKVIQRQQNISSSEAACLV